VHGGDITIDSARTRTGAAPGSWRSFPTSRMRPYGGAERMAGRRRGCHAVARVGRYNCRMPTYEFRCTSCSHQFEVFQSHERPRPGGVPVLRRRERSRRCCSRWPCTTRVRASTAPTTAARRPRRSRATAGSVRAAIRRPARSDSIGFERDRLLDVRHVGQRWFERRPRAVPGPARATENLPFPAVGQPRVCWAVPRQLDAVGGRSSVG
jgi:hypothetical protein